MAAAPGVRERLRFGEGEEARVLPGEAGHAEIWSCGFLPLRARSEARHHARPAFPGTAVVLGDFLPRGPAADPVAPFAAVGALALAGATLRPERVAYRAHREAERRELERLARP